MYEKNLGGIVAAAATAVEGWLRALGFVVHGLAAAATGSPVNDEVSWLVRALGWPR